MRSPLFLVLGSDVGSGHVLDGERRFGETFEVGTDQYITDLIKIERCDGRGDGDAEALLRTEVLSVLTVFGSEFAKNFGELLLSPYVIFSAVVFFPLILWVVSLAKGDRLHEKD